jgi:hypoxanthine phosphoribosyltransferase
VPPPRVLIDATRLHQRVDELAAEVSLAFRGLDELTLIVVLKGGFMFAADLARRIDIPARIEFITLASYGDATERGDIRLLADIGTSLEGKHLLIIDDILDTGHTLAYLNRIVEAHEPAGVRRCVLLNKASRRTADIAVEHVGFEIDDVWVAGYGMDHAGLWRSLPYIGVVDDPSGG